MPSASRYFLLGFVWHLTYRISAVTQGQEIVRLIIECFNRIGTKVLFGRYQ
jgi:hypothetical protein